MSAKRQYAVKLVTAPTGYPVSVSELRQQCSLLPDEQDWDELLLSLQKAAVDSVQRHTGVQMMTATYRLQLDELPASRPIELPMPPLQSVTSFLVDGVAYTAYSADTNSTPGRLIQTDDSWPSVTATYAGIKIEYTAGHTTSSLVPEVLRQAVKLLVAHWFANREAVVTGTIATEIPLGVQRLLDNASIGDEFTVYA